jgi:hypothetical protein
MYVSYQYGKYELFMDLSLASLLWSFLTHLINHCACRRNVVVQLTAIGIFKRIPAVVKFAVIVHTGYFPNVRAYIPINYVFFVIYEVNFNSEK